MRKSVLLACVCLIACSPAVDEKSDPGPPSDAVAPQQATMDMQAEALDGNRVEFVVTTTLPTPIEVMAGVSLKGQAPEDTYIGYSERVKLTQKENTFVIDTSVASHPLPAGNYEAEVSFYPRWGANNGNPDAKNAPELNAKSDLVLKASGQDRHSVERKNKLQKWVMSSLGMNEPWDLSAYEAKLGKAEIRPSTMSHLHDAYYFPEADTTLIVNRLKNEVTVWRLGDQTQ